MSVNEFTLVISSVADGTRPANSWGTAITPTQNNIAGATYAQLLAGASVTADMWEIEIEINSVGAATVARDCIVTIGFDRAGGTSYTDEISNLVAGPAGLHHNAGFINSVIYVFPLRVPSGCSVAAKASVNSATLTAIRVACVLRGKPTQPELTWRGSSVTTFGADTATSAGTVLTPGTAAEGAWTQIGVALTKRMHCWEFGYGVSSATMTANAIHVDVGIGDATNKRVVIPNGLVCTSVNESMTKYPSAGRYAIGAVGDLVYARSQVGPNALDTNNSVAVYGVS